MAYRYSGSQYRKKGPTYMGQYSYVGNGADWSAQAEADEQAKAKEFAAMQTTDYARYDDSRKAVFDSQLKTDELARNKRLGLGVTLQDKLMDSSSDAYQWVDESGNPGDGLLQIDVADQETGQLPEPAPQGLGLMRRGIRPEYKDAFDNMGASRYTSLADKQAATLAQQEKELAVLRERARLQAERDRVKAQTGVIAEGVEQLIGNEYDPAAINTTMNDAQTTMAGVFQKNGIGMGSPLTAQPQATSAVADQATWQAYLQKVQTNPAYQGKSEAELIADYKARGGK